MRKFASSMVCISIYAMSLRLCNPFCKGKEFSKGGTVTTGATPSSLPLLTYKQCRMTEHEVARLDTCLYSFLPIHLRLLRPLLLRSLSPPHPSSSCHCPQSSASLPVLCPLPQSLSSVPVLFPSLSLSLSRSPHLLQVFYCMCIVVLSRRGPVT